MSVNKVTYVDNQYLSHQFIANLNKMFIDKFPYFQVYLFDIVC